MGAFIYDKRMWMPAVLTIFFACSKPSPEGRWMRVEHHPGNDRFSAGTDTFFLEINSDSTFLYKSAGPLLHLPEPGWHAMLNLAGTWRMREGKFLEFTLPPRQEMYVMPFRILHISTGQMRLQAAGSEPDTFTRVE
jgi:hypothetical protein